jgi:hypothetical protein
VVFDLHEGNACSTTEGWGLKEAIRDCFDAGQGLYQVFQGAQGSRLIALRPHEAPDDASAVTSATRR